MQRVTIDINGDPVELRLTPARARILRDLTGLDIMRGFTIDPGDNETVFAFAYALANGERGTGLAFDDFLDAFPFGEVGTWPEKFEAVMRRDLPTGDAEGNVRGPKARRAKQ